MKILTQELSLYRRDDKYVETTGNGRLKRPVYVLHIKSKHSDDGNHATITIVISKGTAEALAQDHGAIWRD